MTPSTTGIQKDGGGVGKKIFIDMGHVRLKIAKGRCRIKVTVARGGKRGVENPPRKPHFFGRRRLEGRSQRQLLLSIWEGGEKA